MSIYPTSPVLLDAPADPCSGHSKPKSEVGWLPQGQPHCYARVDETEREEDP